MKTSLLITFLSLSVFTSHSYAVELIGKTTSKNAVRIVSEVSGVIKTASWQVGDAITASSALAEIKRQDFELAVQKQKASLTLVEADLHINKSTYSRYQALRAKNSLSQNELDVAKADYAAAEANVELAKIELNKAQLDLKNTTVYSPIDGYVVERNVNKGAWVNRGDQLFTLTNIDTLNARLLASEFDLASIHVGQPIQLWAEANPNHKVTAIINRIGVELDAKTFAYPVEIEIENSQHLFRPGMSLHATTTFSSGN